MTDILLILLLIVILAFAVLAVIRKRKNGGGCCGTHGPAVKAIRPSSGSNLTKSMTLKIGGMTCSNCAVRVQNALNSLDGVSAKVSMDTHEAKLRCREDISTDTLREAVRKAGYTVIDK